MPILTTEERLGQVVGARFRLDALLSTGGMGVLFRAFDCEREQAVAVKMLKPGHALEPDRVARFVRETRIAQQLDHPHIARTIDALSDANGVPFLVMELLEGRTLAQELDERGVLLPGEALAIVLPIVHALAAAHALGIVHRDLKPSNIFLCRAADGSVVPKLIDFGIAKAADNGFETETGMLLGTPGYMAPEQVQYAECSTSTDIWGVGAVLYRCLAGHAPHAADTQTGLLHRLVSQPVPSLSVPGIHRQLCATIDRALAREPHRRYASMQAFARALEGFEHARGEPDTEVVRVRPARPRKLRRVWQAAFGGACVLALSAFATAEAGGDEARRVRADARAQPRVEPAAVEVPAAQRATAPSCVEIVQPKHEPIPRVRARAINAPRSRAAKTPAAPIVEHALPIEREATTGLPVAVQW